jgi:hypothetical protein
VRLSTYSIRNLTSCRKCLERANRADTIDVDECIASQSVWHYPSYESTLNFVFRIGVLSWREIRIAPESGCWSAQHTKLRFFGLFLRRTA